MPSLGHTCRCPLDFVPGLFLSSRPPLTDSFEAAMSVRVKDPARDPFRSRPAKRTPLEAAEAAQRRMDDTAYRVEVDRRRGRGASANPSGRYEPAQREGFDDGWEIEEDLPSLP